MDDAYDKFKDVREILGDNIILDELTQYLSTQALEEFADHIIAYYDLDVIEESVNEDFEENDIDYIDLGIEPEDVAKWIEHPVSHIRKVLQFLGEQGITKSALRVRKSKLNKIADYEKEIFGNNVYHRVIKIANSVKSEIESSLNMPVKQFKEILWGIIMEVSA